MIAVIFTTSDMPPLVSYLVIACKAMVEVGKITLFQLLPSKESYQGCYNNHNQNPVEPNKCGTFYQKYQKVYFTLQRW